MRRNRQRNYTDDKFAHKDIKTIVIDLFHMFKKVEERLNMLRRNLDGIKKIESKHLAKGKSNVWDEK